MSKLDAAFVDNIVEVCFNVYNKTPKSGKPVENEWTVLSCVLKYDTVSEEVEVVSLGTGTKCVGATYMSPGGAILNDSHAEVFARRGFLLYLYDNIQKAQQEAPSIFTTTNKRFELKNNIVFIFYSSQLPCGDASIIPKSQSNEIGEILYSKNKYEDSFNYIPAPKKVKLDNDIHRTGAKCLPDTKQDLKEPGAKYHTVGVVRTKPGRGVRTLSVSCSDKIARWTHVGIQGSLLSLLCAPIYIKHYIFGAGTPYSEETLRRAILNRGDAFSDLKLGIVPEFYQSSLQFKGLKTESAIKPAAGSIVWVKLSEKNLFEVAVQGIKLGVTKKNASSPANSLCISKYNLYKRFLDILETNKELKKTILSDVDINSVPYSDMKRKSKGYMNQWSEVKNKFFKLWTVKPEMWDFCIGQ